MKVKKTMFNKVCKKILRTALNSVYRSFFISVNREKKLSIITEPIGNGSGRISGHYAVTRSLVEGLKKLNVSFNINPSAKNLGNAVLVLTDICALQQAINLKRENKIKRLLAGPNLVIRANQYNEILNSKEIDLHIVPSEWIATAYVEDLPS